MGDTGWVLAMLLLAASPDAASLAALGRAHLALGDLDGAVEALRAAAAGAPEDAALLADLAIALLGRAEQRPLSEDALAAVDAAEAALEREPGRKNAAGTRASALARLGLPLAPGPEGDREAQRARFRVARQSSEVAEARALVARDPAGFRRWLELEILPDWAEAQVGRDAFVPRELSLAADVAALLTERTGDALLEETIARIRRAGEAGETPHLAALAQGVLRYREGRLQIDRFELDSAGRALEEARTVLEKENDPLALYAEFYLAVRSYYVQDRSAAGAHLQQLVARAGEHGYAILEADARRTLGLIDAVESRFSSALGAYGRALAIYRRAGDTDAALYTATLVAECHRLLGDRQEEWRIRAEMLPALSGVHDARAATQILLDAADNALRLAHPRAALHLQDAALARGGEHEPEAWVWRARVELALGRPADASRDLDRAESENAQGKDPALVARTEAEILLVRAAAVTRSDPARALALLARAGDYFVSAGLEARLPEIHLQRARAARILGKDDETERQLLQGIEAYERNRPAIEEGAERVSYFDRAEEIFDEMVTFQLDRMKDSDAAFRYAERARARTLADRLGLADVASPQAIASRLPPGTLVLDYLVLPHRLVIWTMGEKTTRRVERNVAAGELAALVAALSDPLEEGRAERAAAALAELLLKPVVAEIGRARTILLVPDKDLHRIPFARLRTEAGTYLVERARIASLPRADLALPRGSHASPRAQASCRVLVAGEPATDARLSRLPGARLEARAVAATWPKGELLLGAAATKKRFLEELAGSDVVHFAGHGVLRDTQPSLSFLALAPDREGGDSGELAAREIEKLRLTRAPLVVLSGCETGGGPLSRSEGALSLARPFLAAGASGVIASLWPIDDASSSRFFGEFHRRLREGLCPLDALRATQLAFLHHSDPQLRAPRAWAAFALFGPAQGQTPEGGPRCPFHSSCSSAASSSSRSRRPPTRGQTRMINPAIPSPRTLGSSASRWTRPSCSCSTPPRPTRT